MESYNGPFKDKLKELWGNNSKRIIVGEHKYTNFANYDKWHELIKNFPIKSTDVWLLSHPKAGSTWSQELIWCIMHDMNSEEVKKLVLLRFPFFEFDAMVCDDPSKGVPADAPFGSPGMTWNYIQRLEDPRTIKSHLHLELLPDSMWTSKPKIVYLCRDPKDVCVSYYYHSLKYEGFYGDFSSFFDIFVNDLVYYGPIWKHILDYWNRRHDENFLFIRYEELKEDLSGMIGKVAKFLGKDLGADYIKKMVDHLSFSSMKNNKAVNYETLSNIVNKDTEDIAFIRKGEIGEWRTHFSKDQVEIFKKWTEKNLKDSDFPYYRDF